MNLIRFSALALSAALVTLPLNYVTAATTSGTGFAVQVTVTAGCAISTDGAAVTFPATAGTAAAPADQTHNVGITCTNGTGYTLYVTSANTVTGNTARIMTNGAESIGYRILQGVTVLGNTVGTGLSGLTGDGSEQTYTLTYNITNWSAVTPQLYTDTATLQVDF